MLFQKLTDGPITKEDLAKWIGKEIDDKQLDIDSFLQPLKRAELIKEVTVSNGKNFASKFIFLLKDVAAVRIPNVELIKCAKSDQMAEDISNRYVEEVERFFKEYQISDKDSGILGQCVSDPDSYEIILSLRNEYCTEVDLSIKLASKIPNIENILRDLIECNIITTLKDKNGKVWLFLLSDIKFPTFFPEYMINVIRKRWKEGTITKEVALKHLELLREEFIAAQTPKYRIKMLKTIISNY